MSQVSTIKLTIQYAFFTVVCIWLLYQIHHSIYVARGANCDLTDNNPVDGGQITVSLGRKLGGVNTDEVGFYGAEVSNDDNHQSKAGEADIFMFEMGHENETEFEVTRVNGSVIMEKGAYSQNFKFSDENGVPDAEFGPSRRRFVDGGINREGSDSKPEDLIEEFSDNDRIEESIALINKLEGKLVESVKQV